jgi:hypothetical protein
MKKYIKKFENPVAANDYPINDIPFIATVASTEQNVHCNEEGKKLVNDNGTIEVVDIPVVTPELVLTGTEEGPWSYSGIYISYTLTGSSQMSRCYIYLVNPSSSSYQQFELDVDLVDGSVQGELFSDLNGPYTCLMTPKWVINGTTYEGTSMSGSVSACFPAGTKIITSLNGETRNIEDIKVGDSIVCYDESTETNVLHTVKRKFAPKSDHFIAITFADNSTLVTSWGHPLLSTLGWKSYVPHVMFNGEETSILQENDTIIGFYNNKAVKSIEYTEEPIQMYTFEVDTYNTFYANDVVVLDTKHRVGGVNKNTNIKLTDGTEKTIESVNIGDIVLARDLSTNENIGASVISKNGNINNSCVELKLQHENDVITLVLSHDQLIYTTEGWKAANETIVDDKLTDPLQVGDLVITVNEDVNYEVTEINHVEKVDLVDLDVDDDYDNFFISLGGGVLTHNRPY